MRPPTRSIRWALDSPTSPTCTSVAAPQNDADAARLCAALRGVGRRVRHRDGRSHAPRARSASSTSTNRRSRRCWPTGASSPSPATTIAWATTFRARSCPGRGCRATCYPGLYVVRVNSTAPHNRSWLNGHGSLDDDDLDAIDVALDAAPAGHLVVIALHHHVLPMPEEHAMERLSSWLGFVFTGGAAARAGPAGPRARTLRPRAARAPPRPARRAPVRAAASDARVQRRLVDRAGARPRVRAQRRGPPAGRSAVAGHSGAVGGRRPGVRRRPPPGAGATSGTPRRARVGL